MRLVFAGTPAAALPGLDALVASEHDVVAVVTRPDARAGRGRALAPSPVKQRAVELGLPVLTPRRPRDVDFSDRLRELAPDACPVVAYGGLIPAEVLAIPRLGWVNLHFSLLPAWRGAAPVQHAIIAGDEVTGATTFLLDEGLDTGPTLGMMTETIRPQDTAGDLLTRLAECGAGLLVATMDGLDTGELQPAPQPVDGVSRAPKLTVTDARIRWHAPALAVDRQIRGCTPAPGAWTVFRDARLKVAPVSTVLESVPGHPRASGDPPAPGALLVTKREVLAGPATEPVRLGAVQPHGKQAMDATVWARGARITPGENLGVRSHGG